MNIIIRDAQPGDEPALVELIQELGELNGESSPVSTDTVKEYVVFPGCHILVGEEQGRVVGLLSYSIRPGLYHAARSAMIEELVVRADSRGHGIGSALVKELLRRVESAGCAEVSVSTMSDNDAARRFYRRHGLTDEALFLERHLPPAS